MTTPANMRWILLDRETGAENQAIEWRFRVGDQVKIRLVNEMDSDHPMHHPFQVHGAGRFLIMSRDGVVEPNLVWKDTVLYGLGNRRHPAGHWIIPNQDHSVSSRDISPVGRRAGRSSVAASPASGGELARRTPCSTAFKPASLNRHVTAPAAIASLTRRRSVLAVRITTRTAGSRDTICRVASTPFTPSHVQVHHDHVWLRCRRLVDGLLTVFADPDHIEIARRA